SGASATRSCGRGRKPRARGRAGFLNMRPARRGRARRTTCCWTTTTGARSDLMPAVSDAVWSEQGTTPDAIEAALRGLLAERHSENGGFVPARVLKMVAFVESGW